MLRDQLDEHVEALLVVVDLGRGRPRPSSRAARAHPQLAGLRDLVRGEDRRGALARLRHLQPQGGLALEGVLDRRVVAHGGDQLGHVGPEALLEVGALGVGVLEHVVQDAGGHHLVGVAGLVQQAGDLDRMGHERQIVDVALLARVAALGEGERVSR